MRPLPVVTAPALAAADHVRRSHRAQLLLARTLAEEVDLTVGTWLRNRDLQPAVYANGLHDAALPPGGDPAAVVAEATAASADCPIRAWTLNPSLPADRTDPLAAHLSALGWVAVSSDVWHLTRLRPPAAAPPAGLTLLPARSAYGPYRRLMAGRYGSAVEIELALLRLDDAHLDAWVAVRDGWPIASVALLTDGDAGTVADLYVVEAERRRGVGQHLLRRAVEASGRAGHRTLLAASPGPFAAVGFEVVGHWVRWVWPAVPMT